MLHELLVGVVCLALVAGCGETDAESPPATPSGAGVGAGGPAGAGGGGTGGDATAGGGSGPTWGEELCPEVPAGVTVGTDVGQQLPSLEVRDCEGNPVSLDRFCGADALFLFALHTWCPICQSVSSRIEAIHDSYAGQNLATVLVVIANVADEAPSAADCQAVRDQHGHEDVVTLYDPSGIIEPIWDGSSGLSAYLDADRIVSGKLVHDGSETSIRAQIDMALAR